MNKFILTAVFSLLAFVGAVSAQETFVGAQYVAVNPNVVQTPFKFNRQSDNFGLVASLTNYQTKSIGLTAEASAVFNSSSQSNQLYTAMGGVTFKSRRFKSVQPFVKGLAGVGIVRVGKTATAPSNSDADVAFKLSTGVDLGSGKIRYRLFEVGYLQTGVFNSRQNNFTLSTGLVF